MLYFYALVMILSGIYLAWFGQKRYGLTFGITYFVSSMSMYFIWMYPLQLASQTMGLETKYPYFLVALGVTTAISVGVWIFTKFFTYLIAWSMIAGPILAVAIKISDGGSNPALGLLALILPIVAVYFLRKILQKTAIGFFSGLIVAFGLLLIILVNKFKSGAIFSEQPTYMFIIIVLFLIGGIYFQFSPFVNKDLLSKEKSYSLS
jgi:hypothetical protein